MTICPNCKAEIEDHFELCWNCNFSLSENKVVDFEGLNQVGREIDCLRCTTRMVFSGTYKFHEGATPGIFGNVFEVFVHRESFDIYVCPKCGKVEFFTPKELSQ